MPDEKLFNIDKFPKPWNDYVSKQVPISIRDALYWCEYAFLSNQTLAAAIRRLVAYFITEIEVLGTDRKEAERLKDYLYNTLYIDSILRSIGLDQLVYGNSFSTVWTRIHRQVICPHCGYAVAFLPYANTPGTDFKLQNNEFHLTCLKCSYRGPWQSIVSPGTNPEDINIIRWSVHEIEINYEPLSGQTEYLWKIPARIHKRYQQNDPLFIANAPDSILEALARNEHYIIYPDMIIHLKEPTISGLDMNGWGLPPILSNFRQVWYLDLLRMANQNIAQDFIIPMRILSPESRAAGPEFGDPTFNMPFPEVNYQLKEIIESWRRDPTSWFSAPFPIRYQLIGGEGGRIIPHQLIEQGMVDLISALGIPIEFFRGSMAVNALPVATRLLENVWASIPDAFNKFLSYLAKELSIRFKWEPFKLRMAKPSHVDDINRQMAKLQLALQGAISMHTGLKSIGLSFEEEMRQQMLDEETKAEEIKKLQENAAKEELNEQMATPAPGGEGMEGLLGLLGMGGVPGVGGMLGVGPAPGAPQPQGGQGAPPQPAPPTNDPVQQVLSMIPDPGVGPVSPQDLLQSAQQIADMIYGMHPRLRMSALRRIASKNEIIHALVLKVLQDKDNQAALQGKIQAQEQAAQQAAPGMAF